MKTLGEPSLDEPDYSYLYCKVCDTELEWDGDDEDRWTKCPNPSCGVVEESDPDVD